MRRPPPGLQPVRYAYGPPSVEKLLGALPVVAEFCRRLDLQGSWIGLARSGRSPG
jgi:hypothetical protein